MFDGPAAAEFTAGIARRDHRRQRLGVAHLLLAEPSIRLREEALALLAADREASRRRAAAACRDMSADSKP